MERTCPKCGSDMEYTPYEPDVGLFVSGWFCTEEGCDGFIEEEDDDYVASLERGE